MFSIDANIFIYAVDGDSAGHEKSRKFLNICAQSSEPIFLCWEVVHAFLRITTSKTIFKTPLAFPVAYSRIRAFVDLPHVQMLVPSRESFALLETYGKQLSLKGKLLTDAVIASQLESNGIKKFYSNDSDFKKFKFLSVANPLK